MTNLNEIEQLNLKDIESNGIVVRSGNNLIKLTVTEKSEVINDEVEFRAGLEEKYGKRYNDVLENVKAFVEKIKVDYDTKEKELDKKLKNSYIMPEIDFQDAKNGISVVKGKDGQFIWLVRGVYCIKTVDGLSIDPKITRRTTTDVVFMVVTGGEKILKISTCKVISLDYFEHYHQNRPDCWGDWWKGRGSNQWKKPDDIIRLAREAESVLENVNTGSIVEHNPADLPRLNTLKKYILEDIKPGKVNFGKLTRTDRRLGIDEHNQEKYVWSTNPTVNT